MHLTPLLHYVSGTYIVFYNSTTFDGQLYYQAKLQFFISSRNPHNPKKSGKPKD